jgi:hypothetical protein
VNALRFDRRGDICAVTFIYDAALVELLKLSVPVYARSWNPVRREWLIEGIYAKQFGQTLRGLGYIITGLEPAQRDDDTTHWARILFKRVGPSRTSAVFRSLSRILHPDVPGVDSRFRMYPHVQDAGRWSRGRQSNPVEGLDVSPL